MVASFVACTRLLVSAVVLLVASAVSAIAADTGTISGTVFTETGEPVPEATVRLTGSRAPDGRTVQTGATGAYRFDYLLPGEYTIAVSTPTSNGANRTVIVELGRDTQVDVVVGVAVAEEITVTAARPLVDVRSTEVSFNFGADVFNALPLEGTYRGLFQLIPGVADNRSVVGPAAGGGRQDNTYLIDGANITNPSFGYLSTEINELDLAEINLKRAGISAEFGRTGGTVTNVISRSGSNTFTGRARMDWLPANLVATYSLPQTLTDLGVRPGTFRDPLLTTESSPAVGVGGPLVHDRLFFYGSARYARETKWDRVNKVGGTLPDEIRTVHEYFGKLTAVVSSRQQLNVSYRHRPNHVENAGLDSNAAASVANNTDNGSGIASADWTTFLSPRSSINLRYLYVRENNEDTPVTNLGFLPTFNAANPAAMGQYTDTSQADLRVGGNQYANRQNYRRNEVRGTFSRFFDVARTSHALKVGGGFERSQEELNRAANGWGLIASLTQGNVPVLRARYYTPQPAQVGRANTYSLFVQDDLIVGRRLSINAGVLVNRDEFAQHLDRSGGCPSTVVLKGGPAVYESSGDTCTFLRFGFGDEVQPRLGVSYAIRNGKSDKAYANWGRYYNMDQKSASRSLAPSRIYQTQTIFDLTGAVLSSAPLASTTGKMIDPDLAPTYTDEILIGYATPIATRYSVDVFFMSRTMNNFIEDLPSQLNGTAPDSGPFVAANLPCTRFAACRTADAKRTYRALTVDVRRLLANGWTSDVSYTWSRFEGNFDLDYSTVAIFNTSSFIQDGPGANVQDPNRFGPLAEDRPHVFKVMTSYTGTSRLTLSGYLRVQSGTPWAARARDWPGAVMNYLEPAASHRNPTWANVDLMAAYRLPLGARSNVSLEARLLNAFNNQTRLSTDSQQYLDLRTIPAPPYFAPYQQQNPFFGLGNAFAPPRRLHLDAVLAF
jgi:hypothetical protein